MNINPIRTDDDYESALVEIEQLFDADVEPGSPEGDLIDVLLVMIRAYESEHYPIPLPDPIAAIEYYMESRNLTRVDLEPYIGTRTRVYEILSRKRPLTLRMIRNLSEGLGIPANILIQPYDLDTPRDAINYQVFKAEWVTNIHTIMEPHEEIYDDRSYTQWFPAPAPIGEHYHDYRLDIVH